MKQGKVVIIGAGHVGSHCAAALAMCGCCKDIVLLDIDENKAKAQAMDVADSVYFLNGPTVVRQGEYAECADAQIVVICVGQPYVLGQTRLDILEDSIIRLKDVIANLKQYELPGIVITITNPADIVADYVRKGLGLERNRVFGTGTLLDTARMLRTVSELTGIDRHAIQGYVLGEHGDSSLIPFSQLRIGGLPFADYGLSPEHVLERTHQIGMEIINWKYSTEFGIGWALTALVQSIMRDEKRIFPVSALLNGEYGQQNLHCGIPCCIGANGIERIIELPLNPAEQTQFDASCQVIRKHIEIAAGI